MQNILETINTKPQSITELDLDEVSSELVKIYRPKLDFLAKKAYGFKTSEETPEVVLSSFKEQAKTELKSALFTFLFKSEHWRTGRDINPYLLTTLNRLGDRISQDLSSAKKTNVPICPLCKENGQREFLAGENKMLRCQACTQKRDLLTEELVKNRNSMSSAARINIEAKISSAKIFALHTRKGYRCPDCSKFIPESANTANGISCPFDSCVFIGNIEGLEAMAHPVTLCQRRGVSLQTTISESDKGGDFTLESTLEADVLDADICIDVHERMENEYAVLCQVIDDQISLIKRTNASSTITQKLLMYEAYKSMVAKYPEEMVSYLVHQKQTSEFPLQARIFQEYVSLVENYLPFTMTKGDATIDIVDLTDPNLSLFLGVSRYDAVVRSNYTIPNNTSETYTGGRKFKNYGPCFIGKIIDIVDVKSNISLRGSIKEHSFVDITMEPCVPVGTEVHVTHFRIPSHYEMGSLVFLQRIRRHLVDKVFFRLNQKKRIPKARKNGNNTEVSNTKDVN